MSAHSFVEYKCLMLLEDFESRGYLCWALMDDQEFARVGERRWERQFRQREEHCKGTKAGKLGFTCGWRILPMDVGVLGGGLERPDHDSPAFHESLIKGF